jgi:hypothetical protein
MYCLWASSSTSTTGLSDALACDLVAAPALHTLCCSLKPLLTPSLLVMPLLSCAAGAWCSSTSCAATGEFNRSAQIGHHAKSLPVLEAYEPHGSHCQMVCGWSWLLQPSVCLNCYCAEFSWACNLKRALQVAGCSLLENPVRNPLDSLTMYT